MIFMNFGGYFEVDKKSIEIKNIEDEISFGNLSYDSDKYSILNEYKKVVTNVDLLKKKVDDLIAMCEFEEFYEDIEKEYKILSSEVEKLKLNTLLNGEYDHNNCYIEIHSGAGGTESNDWANMIFNMYLKYLEKNYKYEIISTQPIKRTCFY